jgi:nicotinate-nucleotide adenylyltransferase
VGLSLGPASTQRLGVFGGAFDPPHLAHVALARAAVEQLALDALHVLPTGQAWHRQQRTAPASDRLAMARIAFAGLPRTVIDDREVRRAGPTYTIDTLRELKAEHPEAQLFLVMGEDQAQAFTRWRDWQAILDVAIICVAARAQPERAAGQFSSNFPAEAEFRQIRLPPMPESATEVRQRLAAGQGIGQLVPEGVARYIDQHFLYQAT